MKAIGNYMIEKESLGKGQFGQVFKCHHKDDATQAYAVKIIQKKILTPRLFTNLKNEITILSKIDHPGVIKLKDIQRTENNFYLIMEFCNGGDLEKLKEIRSKFTELEARIIMQQLVGGFKEIYKQQVMHRDLKLANILVHFPQEDFKFANVTSLEEKARLSSQKMKEIDLVKANIQVKIADLGFARELSYEDLTQTICGTPLVMAPEVLNGKFYNHKADVWSLGIIFFEMITGFTPFTGKDKNDLKRNLEKGVYKLPKKLKMSLQGLDFLNCCLQFDQNKRMSWNDLIKHPYITNDPLKEKAEEQMRLSYSQACGQYVLDDMINQIDQSFMMMQQNPYSYLNEKNAILLNCKDSAQFNNIYEKTIEHHFKQEVGNMQPVLEINQKDAPLAQSMHEQPAVEDSDDNYFDFQNQEEQKNQDIPVSLNSIRTTDMMQPIIDQKRRHQQDEEVVCLDQQDQVMNQDTICEMVVQQRPLIFNSKGPNQVPLNFDIEDANQKLKEIEEQERLRHQEEEKKSVELIQPKNHVSIQPQPIEQIQPIVEVKVKEQPIIEVKQSPVQEIIEEHKDLGYTMVQQQASDESDSLEKKFEILRADDSRSDDELVDIGQDSMYPQLCDNRRNLTDDQLKQIEQEDEIITQSATQIQFNDNYF